MKKLLTFLLIGSLFFSISLTGCSSNNGEEKKHDIYQLYVASGGNLTYDQWLDSIKGADGSTILYGSTNPEVSLGKNGDLYINSSSWDLFVKNGGKWATIGNMNSGSSSSDNFQNLDFYLTDDNAYYVGQGKSTLLSNIVIPESYNGKPVVGVIDYGFEKSQLKSITIPNSIATIGKYAFSGCTNLANIVIPDSVTSIGESAFNNCSSLASISLSKNLKTISYRIFSNCTSLKSIVIPTGVTSIGDTVFDKCTKLESITLPNTLTSIGGTAFLRCASLKSITIPESVTSIGNSAFSGCTSLTNIVIPSGVKAINDNTFNDCEKLVSITIPASVTSIGERAFSGCYELSTITFKGTKAQWNAVTKGYMWWSGGGFITVKCTNGNIDQSGSW